MIKKLIILALLFYLLAVLQTSFLVHFNISGFFPNFILLAVILLNCFEKTDSYGGVFAAFCAGFLSDVFSSLPIGCHFLAYPALALVIKLIFRKYVWSPAV